MALVMVLVVPSVRERPAPWEPAGGSASPSPRRAEAPRPAAQRINTAEQGRRLREQAPSVPAELSGLFAGGGQHAAFGRERLAALCDAGRFCGTCASDADCAPGTGCAISTVNGKPGTACLASECSTDAECPNGGSCRPASLRGAGGTVVSRCSPPGTAQVNAPCSLVGSAPATSCSAGLTCRYDRCAPTCKPGDPCPSGSACVEGACTPKCASDAECPKGETCVPIDEETALCRPSETESCFAQPSLCGQATTCVAQLNAYRVDFYCARPCSAAQPCGGGFICAATVGHSSAPSVCYRPCRASSECGVGRACLLVDQEQALFGCVPEL